MLQIRVRWIGLDVRSVAEESVGLVEAAVQYAFVWTDLGSVVES